ncbi:cytochrome c [Maribellus sp. CM-23]|uniref:c-type cytochrome n=1 Tax=Maribellus sp. CM-23 TaxID=2781026 RepID=UPI001F2A0BD3|nr:cytochrome c [Maribellus sp. CM-23]MCE4566952.1 cytochrome c [Maribellus sp. CM-23]
MKTRVSFLFILLMLANAPFAKAQNEGEKLFKATCMACHTIGSGKLVGPDLKGVNKKVNPEWLISFIRSSQKMIKDGDSLAVALFKEYNQIPMPDNNLSDDQIRSILSYIETKSGGEETPIEQATGEKQQAQDTMVGQPRITYTDAQLNEGNSLFYGYKPFENGAPPCASCHSLNDGILIGGGNLSFNLSQSYAKLGMPGINAILSNPPFPAMQDALKGKDLTGKEKEALMALVHYSGQHEVSTGSFSSTIIFLAMSLVLALFLLIHIYLSYDYRKIPS